MRVVFEVDGCQSFTAYRKPDGRIACDQTGRGKEFNLDDLTCLSAERKKEIEDQVKDMEN